jgi:hypothetical protein
MEEGAGEGLAPGLFNDPIAVLELVLKKNEGNMQARLYLARSYLAKASRGEGRWSKSLLEKAERNFLGVTANTMTGALADRMRIEAHRAVDDIRKIKSGQGELVP